MILKHLLNGLTIFLFIKTICKIQTFSKIIIQNDKIFKMFLIALKIKSKGHNIRKKMKKK